jgi:hypothetical protein
MKKQTIATNLLGRRVKMDYHCWRQNSGTGGEPLNDNMVMPRFSFQAKAYNDKEGEVVNVYLEEGVPVYSILMADGQILEHTSSFFTVLPAPPAPTKP